MQIDIPQSSCCFGLARTDITPPVGIYHRMWGAAMHERASGVHRPLTATAMVFQPADRALESDRQVVIAVDHCLLWAREMESLLGSVAAATGLPREQFVVAFSHTHAAGLMDLSRAGLPGGELIGPYLDMLAERISQIVTHAIASVQPATICYTRGRCDLAAHRDFWDEASGQFVCGFNPSGPADDTVLVARVTRDNGRLLATVVNYACHPTTLAWENTQISPDYPGAMRELVERATGAPCVFLQGASGDLGPREGFVGDAAIADRNGRQLAYAVLAALESLPSSRTRFEYAGPVVSGATLGTWRHVPLTEHELAGHKRWRSRRWTLDLPYRPELPTLEQTQSQREAWVARQQAAQASGDTMGVQECRAMIERCDRQLTRLHALPRGKCFPLPIALWQMGNAVWLAVEAEHYQILQVRLRERFPQTPIVVTTLANGSRCSYLPEREAYGKGIYQESIAVLAPGCLEMLVDAVGEQIAAWVGD